MSTVKKSIGKKEFSLDSLKDKFSTKTKYKADRFIDLGSAFQKATGVPGPALGHLNVFLGHSDTGKTTALLKSAIWCQQNGILPIFIITEKKWSFSHAQLMGLEVTESNGNWDGFFLFRDDFGYIEQITDYMNEVLESQSKGEIPYDICFFWDSVGSIPCKMTYDGKGGKMHNASVLSDKIGMGLNGRITSSRKETTADGKPNKYTNTIVFVNQPWVELPDSPMGQPKIKMKGGEAIYLNSTLIFLFGNQKGAGTNKIMATKNGRKIKFATRTKISILKNHVNGIGYEDGKVIVTPHSFIDDTKEAEEQYKKEYSDFWSEMFIKNGLDIKEGEDFELEGSSTDVDLDGLE